MNNLILQFAKNEIYLKNYWKKKMGRGKKFWSLKICGNVLRSTIEDAQLRTFPGVGFHILFKKYSKITYQNQNYQMFHIYKIFFYETKIDQRYIHCIHTTNYF
jgi:hypothetical protein